MKRKTEKKVRKFLYEGFGFPVLLLNVTMKKIYGEWFVDLNLNDLQEIVLQALIRKPIPLNGNELQFIRKYFEMTTEAFGKLLGVTHVAVLKWENGQTHVSPAAEMYIRLYVFDRLHPKDKEFRNFFYEMSIENLAKHRQDLDCKPIEIDATEEFLLAS